MPCVKCGRELNATEIGLSKKLINRGGTKLMCLQCLSEYFGVTKERLIEKAEEFRKSGCTLFPPDKD